MGKLQRWLTDFLEIKQSSSEILSIQYLRGIAACMVMLFHFNLTNETEFNGVKNIVHEIGKRGYIGVEIFFCISGFVLLFALIKSKYAVSDFGNFFLRRIVRIEPPYILAVLLIVTLNLVRNSTQDSNNVDLSVTNILMHFGYINMFTGKWLSPVFWTLGIEFTFYLFIGLAFPFVVKNKIQRALAFGLFFLSCPLTDWHFLPFYAGYFILGMAACLFYLKLMNKEEFFIYLVLSSLSILFSVEGIFVNGLSSIHLHSDAFIKLGVSLLAVYLFFQKIKFNFFLYLLGLTSYSIYLLHNIVGTRLIIKALDLPYLSVKYIVIYILACIVSIVASILYYKYIELPSLRWAKRLAKSKS
jgi:peptidoglycan/LPS O-acetylase OafA/YrhL